MSASSWFYFKKKCATLLTFSAQYDMDVLGHDTCSDFINSQKR